MSTQAATTINLFNKIFLKQAGMVVLPVEEYNRLKWQAVPTYHLTGKAAKEVDALVEEGLRDYRAGKCKPLSSLIDL